MKRTLMMLMVGIMLTCNASVQTVDAEGVPVEWKIQDGGNGHFYEPVSLTQPILWTEARDAAITAGGHLCTITSELENDFVFDIISGMPEMWTFENGDMGPWLGGFQVEGAIEPSGGWAWVTGEPFVYTNWAAGQPDNMANTEHWLHFYKTQLPKQWNDTGFPNDHVYSYIVEYVPEPAGPVAYWSFDNESDAGHDDSGNGHDGTVNGATITDGICGKALDFDGNGDYVDVANAAGLNPTDAITITAWFKADSFALGSYSWPPIVKKSDNSQTHGYTLEIEKVYEGTPSLGGAVYIEGQGVAMNPEPLPLVTVNTWYFAAMVYDGSTISAYLCSKDQDFLTAYESSSKSVPGTIAPSSNNLNIGRDPSNTSRFFKGVIDEVRIYDRALSENEMSNLFNECIPSEPQPVEMEWVTISEPGFTGQMSKYETTNAQYCQFLNEALASGDIVVDGNDVKGANGSNSGTDFVGQVYYNLAGSGYNHNGAPNGGAARINYSGGVFTVDSSFENHPVTYVSWYGSAVFCNYYGYRLPTEWEWQAVADYDGSYTYGCGTSLNNSIANYYNSTHPDGTAVVGGFGTYGYGICDMSGNALEWTSSLWVSTKKDRVVRGGGWSSIAYGCDVSYRYYNSPTPTGPTIGFRVARNAVPDIDVSPLSHDFGNVELGTSRTLVVTISNVGTGDLTVSGIALETDFAITSVPSVAIVIGPSETNDVEITYTPSALGYNSAVLKITSDDPDEPVVEVMLSAVGITIPPPLSEQIASILSFFDTSVADATLEGDGPGKSAEKRLNALRNKIEAASDLIEGELFAEACQQLKDVSGRMDGQHNPPDFVKGESVEELETMVQSLITSLGC